MATGGSAPTSAMNLKMELITRLKNVQLGEVTRKIEGIEGQLNASRNVVEFIKCKQLTQL